MPAPTTPEASERGEHRMGSPACGAEGAPAPCQARTLADLPDAILEAILASPVLDVRGRLSLGAACKRLRGLRPPTAWHGVVVTPAVRDSVRKARAFRAWAGRHQVEGVTLACTWGQRRVALPAFPALVSLEAPASEERLPALLGACTRLQALTLTGALHAFYNLEHAPRGLSIAALRALTALSLPGVRSGALARQAGGLPGLLSLECELLDFVSFGEARRAPGGLTRLALHDHTRLRPAQNDLELLTELACDKELALSILLHDGLLGRLPSLRDLQLLWPDLDAALLEQVQGSTALTRLHCLLRVDPQHLPLPRGLRALSFRFSTEAAAGSRLPVDLAQVPSLTSLRVDLMSAMGKSTPEALCRQLEAAGLRRLQALELGWPKRWRASPSLVQVCCGLRALRSLRVSVVSYPARGASPQQDADAAAAVAQWRDLAPLCSAHRVHLTARHMPLEELGEKGDLLWLLR